MYKTRYAVENNQLVVYLCGRAQDGSSVVQQLVNTQPYLYARKKLSYHQIITGYRKEGLTLDNDELYKVFTKYPFHVPAVRELFDRTWEADVPYADRIRFDLKFKHTIETPARIVIQPDEVIARDDLEPVPPVISTLDIETDDRHGVPSPKYPTSEVISWSEYNNQKDRFVCFVSTEVDDSEIVSFYEKEGKKVIVKCVDTENRLFKALDKYYTKFRPDVITGWYVDDFDISYMKARAKSILVGMGGVKKFPTPFDNSAIVDAMAGYAKLQKGVPVSKALDYVSMDELGEGKMEREGTWEMYERNPEKLVKYNIRDVDLTWRIIQKADIIGHFVGVSQLFGSDLNQFRYNGQAVKSDVYHGVNGIVAIPTKGSLQYTAIDKGGFVHDPYYGLCGPSFCLDLKTAYPAAIISLNLSNDTLIPIDSDYDGEFFRAKSGRRYRKDPVGLIPHLLKRGLSRRDEVKSLMYDCEYKSDDWWKFHKREFQMKTIYNTYFGMLGSPNFPLTAGDIASDITGTVREAEHWIIGELRKLGCIDINADTDGVHFIDPNLGRVGHKKIIARGQKIAKKIDATFDKFAKQFNCGEDHLFHATLDYIAETYFQWGAKKRYALLVLWDGEQDVSDRPLKDRIVVKGAQSQRSDASRFTKQIQKHLFEIGLVKGENAVREFVLDVYEEMKKGKFSHDLGIPIALNKGLKGSSQHVKAARYSNKFLGKNFKAGDKPWMYLVKGVEGKPKTPVCSLEWDDEPEDFGLILDEKANMERHIVKPLSSILMAMGVSLGEIISHTKQMKGDDYWESCFK